LVSTQALLARLRASDDRRFGAAQVAFGKTVVFYRATAASRLEALRAAAHARAVLRVAAVARSALVLKTRRRLGSAAATLEGALAARPREIRELRPAVAEAHAVAAASVAFLHGFLPAAFEAALERGDAVLKALEEGERLAGILEALVAKNDAAAHYDDLERALKAVDAVADPDATRGAAWKSNLQPDFKCAYSNVLTQAPPLCFENSMRAIGPFKSQPNRLRLDRARECQSLVGTSRTGG